MEINSCQANDGKATTVWLNQRKQTVVGVLVNDDQFKILMALPLPMLQKKLAFECSSNGCKDRENLNAALLSIFADRLSGFRGLCVGWAIRPRR
jgi:hypothetical protein